MYEGRVGKRSATEGVSTDIPLRATELEAKKHRYMSYAYLAANGATESTDDKHGTALPPVFKCVVRSQETSGGAARPWAHGGRSRASREGSLMVARAAAISHARHAAAAAGVHQADACPATGRHSHEHAQWVRFRARRQHARQGPTEVAQLFRRPTMEANEESASAWCAQPPDAARAILAADKCAWEPAATLYKLVSLLLM